MKSHGKLRKPLAFLLTLCLVLALAACGGGGGSTGGDTGGGDTGGDAGGGDTGGGSAAALEVKIWDNLQVDGLRTIANKWSEQSGIPVNIQVVDWDNYWTLLEAGASGGQLPDVFWMHSNNAQMYMENGMLLDLTDRIAGSDVVNLDNYYEGVTNLYSLDGHQYAVPKDHDTIALLYNKAIFDAAGVDYPTDEWTWDDYYEAGKAITEAGAGDYYGIAMDTTNTQDGFYNIVYSYGGYVISDDKKTSGWDDPQTKEAMEFVGKLCSDVFVPQAVVSENGTDVMFNSGLVGMITQGTWMISTFYNDDDSENYAWEVLPYHDADGNGQCDPGERVTMYNGLGWAASADTQQPDAAWSLIEWFGSYEEQIEQAELGVTMAAYKDISEAFEGAFPGMDISAFVRIEDEGTLVFYPYSKYGSRWEELTKKELVNAWNDPSQMSSVLDELAAGMNELLAKE